MSNTKSGLTTQGRHLQFTRVVFGSHGNWFVAGDQHGHLFLFDLARNKYKLLHKAGQSCTALGACISRPNEVLMALADYTLRCIDVGECCNIYISMYIQKYVSSYIIVQCYCSSVISIESTKFMHAEEKEL